jgi:hypothetical protein
MKKLLLLFLAIFIGAGISYCQTTLVGWDFNFSGANTSGIPANSGTTISSSPAPIFSSVGCSGGEMIVNSMGPGNSMVSTSFSTLGYTSVNYSFIHSEFSVARNFSFQYSLNGSTWTNVVASYSPPINGGCSPWYTASNVAMPAAVDNKATVYLRWFCNSGSGAGGTRLDEVVIKGTASCTDPTIPTITSAPGTICDGNSALLTISGTKNDATAWHVYSGSCGGTSVGTTAGSTIIVTPTPPGTTYYVRGEGGCVTPGSCGSILVSTTARENATFNYSASAYCADATDPTPTITGVGGGSFTAAGGLALNASSGQIDVSASTPGTYTVTYTTSGLCAGDEDVSVTINALDDASFSYADPSYCQNDSDPTPTITGLGSGSFSAGAGLSINASNGAVDLSASTPGTYTVTYTTSGTCPNSSNITLTVNALDNAAFSYSAASYCSNDSDPTPTITGLGGGGFTSAPGGLTINAGTGAIDVSTSTPGTYTVTYATTGTCPNSSSVSVTINALDNASFNYSAAAYCADDSDPSPTITGLGGGSFSVGAGLSINTSTGAIDVSTSTPGTYTVTYTTTGTCPNSSNVSVTINALDNASFNYSAGAYCADASDPTPTITGLGGGGFTSAPGGLTIISGTGAIDVSASTPGTYTVTYTTTGACPNSSGVSVTVNASTSVTFTALADLCVDAGVQSGLGSGAVAGGVYSGPGVTDDGNGNTYSFDPASAGVGIHSITYTGAGSCAGATSDNVEVFALPTVTFTALSDLCIDGGVQTGQGGGAPTGGIYSGPGVTDDGNGLTYSFDPSAAGVGAQTIQYFFTSANGCFDIANDGVYVNNTVSDQTVTANELTICEGTSTTIDLGSSEIGVEYTLRDNSNNAIIDGPMNGTGSAISLNTGNISSSMTYNVYGETINPGALNFTGNAGLKKVSLGTDLWTDNFAGNNNLTVEAWINRSSNGTLHTIVGNYEPGSYPMLFRIDGDQIRLFLNSVVVAQGTTVIPTGTWTHVSGTYDGSVIKVYVNGVLDGQTNHSSAFQATSNEIKIGGGLPNNTEYFPGDIADVRMWNVARSQSEIFNSMNSVLNGNEAGLIANYQFTEGSGTTTSNMVSGNAYPGTIVNNPAWGAGPFTSSTCGVQLSQLATVTMNPNPTVTFTAPSDVCTGASTLTGQGSGAPVGGVYSGTGVTDDGNGMTYSFDPSIAGNGSHTITYSYTDGNGCSANASDDIEVGDATAPTVVCQDVTIYLDASGDASIVAADIDGGTTDNCSSVTLSASQTAFTCADVGTPVNVTLTATDGNLNSDNCVATVTVLDTISPVPSDATLADLNAVCEITSLTDPTATDNCGSVTVSHDATLPITINSTITWSYDDGNGNITTQEQNVVLLDAVLPTATNPDTLYFECMADAVIDVLVVDDEADNCSGVITVSHSGDVVSGNGCQDTITRTYNVMDGSGNNIDVTQIIIIEDVTLPTASNLSPIVVQCAGDIPAASPSDVSDAADNCAVPTVTFVSDVSDGLSCPETITRTYSVTDNCANSIDVTQIITVHDTELPVADEANLPQVKASCDVVLTAPTATDNCAGNIIGTTTTLFPLNETTTVTWNYTDACGNTTSQTQEVFIDPINTDIHVSPGDGQISSLNTDSGVTFQWINCSDNSNIDGETESYYLPTAAGMYAVIITQSGCTDTSECVSSTVGMDEFDANTSISIYPNPNNGVFTIELSQQTERLKIIDALGKVVYNIKPTSKLINVELSNYEEGIYFVQFEMNNELKTERIVIRK